MEIKFMPTLIKLWNGATRNSSVEENLFKNSGDANIGQRALIHEYTKSYATGITEHTNYFLLPMYNKRVSSDL